MGMNVEAFVDAVVSGKTHAEIAKASGVSVRTVGRKLKEDAEVRVLIAEERRMRREAITRRVGAAREDAVAVMVDLLKSVDERVRLRAAVNIMGLDTALQDREEFEGRIRALEEFGDGE